jgi:hypothetical protein
MACKACGSGNPVTFPAELELKIYIDPTRAASPMTVVRQEISICLQCGAVDSFLSQEELDLLKQFGGSSSMWL